MGIYLYPKVSYPRGLELYHTAARLREDCFCYLSLESVLSEAGVISQQMLGWITVITGGRSGTIGCGARGTIEFIHTKKKFETVNRQLCYDARYKLWRASVQLALHDMKSARRPMDLIDWEAANEFI